MSRGRILSRRMTNVRIQYMAATLVYQLSVNVLSRGKVKVSWLGHTTVIVPINTFGGFALIETISAMKLAVRPIMAMSEQAWKIRAIWNVALRACILN